ncbi:acyl-CoA thioesterase [bacterium]|nr:acyl-CoA thioesterase [bacterium]
MPRLQLKEQPLYEFSHQLQIRVYDTGGFHVNYDKMGSIIREGAVQCFRTLELNELNMGDNKTGLITSEIAITFKKELMIGDIVTIQNHIGEIDDNSFRLFTSIMRDGSVVVLAETRFVAFSNANQIKTILPSEFMERLDQYRSRAKAS